MNPTTQIPTAPTTSTTASEENIFRIAQRQFDEAAEALGLADATRAFLREPQVEAHFTLPVERDDGGVGVYKAYRVQYSSARGPAKGGLRWHPAETVDTVRALAAWMTWKTALLDLPLGGGKGGVVCDPRQMSDREQERLARTFMRAMAKVIGPDIDVPAPDVYTNPSIMGWMMDEYEAIVGQRAPGIITGKPLSIGGSLGRNDATGRGAVYCVREALKARRCNLSDQSYAIQGFGNAGQFAAQLHQEVLGGGKLVAISDSRGGVFNPDGIDPAVAIRHKVETGTVLELPGTNPISNPELLELPVDVLYPSGLEGVITEHNADRIQAKFIVEVANGPTTPEADRILHEKGALVLPDFLANAGGVTVSYFEQVQNQANFYWDLETVHQRLDSRMSTAFGQFYARMQETGAHPRLAAYMVAVERVAEACVARGWVKSVR